MDRGRRLSASLSADAGRERTRLDALRLDGLDRIASRSQRQREFKNVNKKAPAGLWGPRRRREVRAMGRVALEPAESKASTAEQLARALGPARWTGNSWRTRCPSHPDKHPSLDVAEKNGKILFVCRAGCPQAQILEALREHNLWSAERASSRPVLDPFSDSAFGEPRAEACCFEGYTCEHWRLFDADLRIAHLHAELCAAVKEIAGLFRVAGFELGADELGDELRLAADVGGIGITHASPEIQQKIIDVVVAEVVGRDGPN